MLKRLMIAAVGFASLTGLANAADLAPPEPESDWVFTAAPYLWLAGLNGDVAAFGAPEVDIDVSAVDVLKHLDMGFMGAAEARNGRFSIGGDLVWAKISGDKNTPFGILADKVELTAETLMVTGVGGYSLFYGDNGNLDAVAGARLWSVDNTLDFKGGGLLGGRSFNDGETWIDPVAGIKGRANISPDFYVTGWGLIGGFGVSSDLMWDVMGGVGYDFNETSSMLVGYRGLGVDYHDGGFVYDVVQHGPMLGGVFRF